MSESAALPIERVGGLYLRRTAPRGALRGRVLWIHGAGEHGGRHAPAALRLAQRGWEIWLPDLPGHGETGGAMVSPTLMRAALAQVLRAAGGGPPFDLVGHSMGGLLAIGLAREAPVPLRRCVLSAPFLAPAQPIPRWKLRSGRLAARFWPSLRFSLDLGAEQLLRDPREQRAWRADRARRAGIEARAGAALLDEAARRCAETEALRLPCLVLLAGDDRVACSRAAHAWADRCGAMVVELAGFRHEITREPEGAVARMAIERWLADA